MKIPVAVKILNEATGPKANVEFMDVSILGKTDDMDVLLARPRYEGRLLEHVGINPGGTQKQQKPFLFQQKLKSQNLD